MACPEAVYLSYILLVWELWCWREHGWYDSTENQPLLFQQKFQRIYLIFLVVTLMIAVLNKRNSLPAFLNYGFVIAIIPYFYLTDSLAAVALAYAIIHTNLSSAVLYLEVLSNFFMLNVINKTFAPSKPHGTVVSLVKPVECFIYSCRCCI
jgi:hypothetical protein